MARRILLHLAFLGLGSIWPSVQGPNFHVLAVDLNSLLEERESTQIPKNGSAPLLVSVQVLVSNVFNVDILRYTVSYMLILRLSWLDARLAWNASTSPRHVVTLPMDSLWTPGLSIREALWTEWKDQSPQAVVAQDGHVEINLSLTTEANCDFELLHFPRDQSHCNLSFFVFSNTGAARAGPRRGGGRGPWLWHRAGCVQSRPPPGLGLLTARRAARASRPSGLPCPQLQPPRPPLRSQLQPSKPQLLCNPGSSLIMSASSPQA